MPKKTIQKQAKLKDCIMKMASKSMAEDEIDEIINELEEIYTDDFRHTYAEFFNWILYIEKENSCNEEYLTMNLAAIDKILDEDESGKFKENFKNSFIKLNDHINLEIGRCNYYHLYERKLDEVTNILEESQDMLKAANSNLSDTSKKIDNTQKEYIAILGIFASIVLAFTAGISFSTSVLENMHQSSVYRVIIVSLVIGIVLLNVLYALFNFVSQLSGQKSLNLKALEISNGVLISLVLAVFLLWMVGSVESRNASVNDYYTNVKQTMVNSITLWRNKTFIL